MDPHDHYGDGAWYDAEYIHIRADVPYYARVAGETKGAILELACGTGRLTIPMVRAGGTVHGIDRAPGMIARAEEKRAALPSFQRERLSFEVADMRTLRMERKFEAVVLGFNTLMHMISDDDLSAALETVRLHLLSGGRFYFDLHTPFPELLTRDPTKRYDPQEMIDPHGGERYVVTESNEYDARTQINRMYFFYQRVDRNGSPQGSEKRAVLLLRVIFPRELDRWLHTHGFEVVGDWDDFECKNPFSGKGGRRVVVARAR
jgi:SAM-dependent methyltransferase